MMSSQKEWYDELLAARVKQLKEIDEWLERFAKLHLYSKVPATAVAMMSCIRADLADMIRKAEAEHAAF